MNRAEVRRAALYARVSTASQTETTSLPTQLNDCRSMARRNTFTIVDEYVDAGVSGVKANRPALDRLMQDARMGLIDVILVAKLDRLGRSMLNLLSLLEELDRLDIQVVSISESFDTHTSSGRLQLSILGSVAEFERSRTRDRIMSGLHARAAEGGFVASRPPFGYRAVPDPRGRGVLLGIDEEQAGTIRRILELLVDLQSGTAETLRVLNEEGRMADTGRAWTRGGLIAWARRIGPVTASGSWSWGGKTISIPPIIDEVQFSKWHAWLSATSTGSQRTRGPYLLSGRIQATCGSVYQGRHAVTAQKSQAPIYICKERSCKRAKDPTRCDDTNIHMADLDEAVWSEIAKTLTDPTALSGLLSLQAGDSGIGDKIIAASARVTKLQAGLVAEYRTLTTSGFDPATASLMMGDSKAVLEAAKVELGRLGRKQGSVSNSQDINLFRSVVAGRFEDFDSDERRRVIDLLDTRIFIEGFEVCGHCRGSGMIKLPEVRAPVNCPTCHRMIRLPLVKVTISVLPAILGESGELNQLAG